MKIRLIAATVSRVEPLRRLLSSLTRQSFKNFEIFLCDQNSDDRLLPIIDAFRDELEIRHIRIPRTGVSFSRNKALEMLPDEDYILGFPDDDCFYEEDTLAQTEKFFQSHPECGALLGDWLPEGQTFSDGRDEPVNKYSAFYRGGTLVQFFVHKKSDPVILFDEDLGPGGDSPYGCGEDTDYLLQFMNRFPERSVMRVPAVHFRHPEAAGNFSGEKIRDYARGRMYLLKKHRYSLVFRIATVLYPLGIMLVERPKKFKFRWEMFYARLQALFYS